MTTKEFLNFDGYYHSDDVQVWPYANNVLDFYQGKLVKDVDCLEKLPPLLIVRAKLIKHLNIPYKVRFVPQVTGLPTGNITYADFLINVTVPVYPTFDALSDSVNVPLTLYHEIAHAIMDEKHTVPSMQQDSSTLSWENAIDLMALAMMHCDQHVIDEVLQVYYSHFGAYFKIND